MGYRHIMSRRLPHHCPVRLDVSALLLVPLLHEAGQPLRGAKVCEDVARLGRVDVVEGFRQVELRGDEASPCLASFKRVSIRPWPMSGCRPFSPPINDGWAHLSTHLLSWPMSMDNPARSITDATPMGRKPPSSRGIPTTRIGIHCAGKRPLS